MCALVACVFALLHRRPSTRKKNSYLTLRRATHRETHAAIRYGPVYRKDAIHSDFQICAQWSVNTAEKPLATPAPITQDRQPGL
jgi:hypothetical protein